jgi:hypothetical protein
MLTRSVQVNVRLDAATADKIEQAAQKFDLSAASFIRQLCQDYDAATGQLRVPK